MSDSPSAVKDKYALEGQVTDDERFCLYKLEFNKHRHLKHPAMKGLSRCLGPGLSAINAHLLSCDNANARGYVIDGLIKGMLELDTIPQSWGPSEWSRVRALQPKNRYSYYLTIVAAKGYGSFPGKYYTDLGPVSYQRTARVLFGIDAVDQSLKRITDSLYDMGYTMKYRAQYVQTVTAALLLFIGTTDLNLVTQEIFLDFTKDYQKRVIRKAVSSLSNALCNLGILPKKFTYASVRVGNRGPQKKIPPNVDPIWKGWADSWRDYSILSLVSKTGIYSELMIVGRWLKRYHPEVTSPDDWTFELANKYVQFVDQMKVGELLEFPRPNISMGEPLAPNSKVAKLRAIKTFFRELEETEQFKCTFNFYRAFAVPREVQRSKQRQPRPIDDDYWMKIRAAAIAFNKDDLPAIPCGLGNGVMMEYQYPFEMMKAIALTWAFSGCRSDEIERLQLGCVYPENIQPQRERATGIESPGFVQYMLLVPVSKTKKAYVKPIEEPMAIGVLAWEKVRTRQPRLLDPTTGELVSYLFCHRGRRAAAHFINRAIIPKLLAKAGMPRSDSRGKITSHRARSTMATNLYNNRNGMTALEVMSWLGHSSFGSTQHYLELKPLTLIRAFNSSTKLSESLRYVNVLVDRAPNSGDPSIYYDLGHGWCTNYAYAACAHRMACAKCDFYRPAESSREQLLQQSGRFVRMLQTLELTEEERLAVSGDEAAARKLLKMLSKEPVPSAVVGHYEPRASAVGEQQPIKLSDLPKK